LAYTFFTHFLGRSVTLTFFLTDLIRSSTYFLTLADSTVFFKAASSLANYLAS